MANSPLEQLSTEDLKKYVASDLKGMSTPGLKIIASLPEDKSDLVKPSPNDGSDADIANRPSAIADLTRNPTTLQHPLGAVLRTIGGASELYQGLPASIALDLQKGRPQDIASNLGKVFTGQRPAQYGDVFQGVGAGSFSPAAGLYTDLALSPGGAKGMMELGKGIGGVGTNVIKSGGRIVNSFRGKSAADLMADLAQRKVDIQTEVEQLGSIFKQKYSDIVSSAKKEIPTISKKMSDAYGQGLEDIFSKLDQPLEGSAILKKNAPAITNQEIVDRFQGLVDRAASDPLIVKSPAYQKTVAMLDYFKNGLKSEAGFVDESGNLLKSNAPNAVDIKDLIAKTRDVRNTIKASTQSGSAPVGAQDYFATQFDKTIGGLLKDRVEGFSELQASYAKMANTRKVAYKLFKPLADEDSATSFLNRIKNDNMKNSDYQLLKFLQSGGKVAGKDISGMGDFSTELSNLGKKVKDLNSGKEIKQLGARIAQRAADEKFRNKFLLWVAGTAGVGSVPAATRKVQSMLSPVEGDSNE